jgi:hypothetical protein
MVASRLAERPPGAGPADRQPRFLRVETFSPRNVLHTFRLSGPDEVDIEFAAWLAEAYRVGAQEHLRRSSAGQTQDESGDVEKAGPAPTTH